MDRVTWSLEESVAVLSMNSGENRLNIPFMQAMLAALDDIETSTEAATLLIVSSDSKIWCNGMDLDWLVPALERNDPDLRLFFECLHGLYKRLTLYPMITVAAVTGHAFAGGAILAASCDFRYMRSDRGFFCFPEVDLNIPFSPYMDALIKRAFPVNLVMEAELQGHRFTAGELERWGVIRKACASADDTLKEALAWARGLNKSRDSVGAIKRVMNADIARLVDEELQQGRVGIFSG